MRKYLSIFHKATVAAAPDDARRAVAVRRPPPPVAVKLEPVAPPPVPQLTLGLDLTASREPTMAASIMITDALLAALPGQLKVNLAAHGGGKLHTWTRFESDAGKLRDRAAAVRCRAGYTAMLPLLARVLETEGIGTIVYIGDAFEESEPYARKLAEGLALRGTRIIILHDTSGDDTSAAEIFAEMAAITSGAVLPFDLTALPKLRELLEAVAVLAVGDVPLLRAREKTMPAARLLLEHLGKGKPK